jgi:uncharacterized membrane protein
MGTSAVVTSSAGWWVLLVSGASLAASLAPPIRRLGGAAAAAGMPCLYVVLASAGASARLEALWSTPAWLAFGAIVVAVHGATLAAAGRWLRLPLALLATASQANIGGVVSAPLVAAVYQRALVPVGLVLAVLGNAVGTYVGWLTAMLCRTIAG